MIKNCGAHYTERLKKIIEIKGERLEQYHLNQIKKEVEVDQDKENDEEEKEFNDKNGEKEVLKMKIVYNDKRLGILKKRKLLI